MIGKVLNYVKQMMFDKNYREYYVLSHKYSNDRYREAKLRIHGGVFKVPDVASFCAMWKEIVMNQCYEFKISDHSSPVIIDFGANVGVSVYYFANKYKNAQIYAYEADPQIYKYLVYNVKQFDNGNIHLFNKAVSDTKGIVKFYHEGSDAGRLAKDNEPGIDVETECAWEILQNHKKIDMLKIDIEGAERYVLPSISDQLGKVDNIFLEYHSEKDAEQCIADIINLLGDFRIFIHPGYCPSKPLYEITDYMGYDMELNIYGVKNEV